MSSASAKLQKLQLKVKKKLQELIPEILSGRDTHRLNREEFNELLAFSSRRGHWEEALGLLRRAPLLDVSPDVASYTSAIAACAKAKGPTHGPGVPTAAARWPLALRLLRGMLALRATPNVFSYGAAISATASAAEWKLAMELIQELSHSRIQPSVICCNALLTAYANSTLWERALHLFLHMEKELRADDVSLGAAIAACSDFSTWPWALSLLFSQLRGRRGVSAVLRDDRPNAVAINAALRSCEISTAWASAMGVHAEFGEFSLRAEEHITRARHMMAICGRAGRWEWALFFFDRAMKYGASETSYNTAITACERSGAWQQALSLFDQMCSNRLASTRSYGSIINAFQSSAQWRLAVQLLHQMWIDRTEWNTVTCNAALSSCEKAGERKMALFLLQSMTRQSVQADEITYNAAISACERTDRWDLALHLLAEMQSNSLPPSDTSLTAAISACKTPGEWERALRLMAGLGMQQAPSTISTNALLFCLAHASQWELSFSTILSYQAQRDHLSYQALIAACRAAMKWQYGLALCESMPQVAQAGCLACLGLLSTSLVAF
ncbi:unnamed protein product [Durusdinium trenchii]|uniref:PROP1-like PPR domain-containing protein n=3 Tax=Durusdinium trenchii TaxID=1381693 RepID=A0ABP0RAK6_9DINO